LDNEQWLWVSPGVFTDTTFTSLPVTNTLAGPAIVTVFVNGIPSVSQSLTVTLTVNPAATTTSLASSLNPSAFGQTVTFTATVASDGGTPTGTVTFKDGATTLGTSALSGDVATFSTASLAVGVHSITTEYSGDGNYSGSVSDALVLRVNQYLFLPIILK
jgi:hypothetical protein